MEVSAVDKLARQSLLHLKYNIKTKTTTTTTTRRISRNKLKQASRMSYRALVCLLLALAICAYLEGLNASHEVTAPTKSESRSIGSLQAFFGQIKKASARGVGYASNMLLSIPFTKMLMVGGALLSLFFIFLRLIIVLGPIMLLAMASRESTDASDLLKILIEFYNQIVLALDEQMSQQNGPNQVTSG